MNSKYIFLFIFFSCITSQLFAHLNFVPDSIPKKDACNWKLDKFIDHKLYITTDTLPDELKVFLDNKQIPFRRNAKTISIYLPSYINTIEKTYLRIQATKSNQLCKELIILLQNGKPSTYNDTLPVVHLNETKKIVYQKVDSSVFEKTIEPVIEKEKPASILPSWISVYVDAYYALYNDSVGSNAFQKFTSISPRSNAIGLNTAQINFQYDAEKIRATLVLHYGDFAKTSWPAEFNNIMEAHAGIKLSKKLWIDAGFFRTHLGTEGLLPRENICSSLAIGTYYEPAYISGIRFNYLPNEKWNLNLYILNSFNGFVDNNDKKSIGMLITYAMNDKGTIGYSNYLGDDTPKEVTGNSHFRIHQNIFLNYQFNKLKLQLGGDLCLQENSDLINPTKSASMFSGLSTLSYSFDKLFSIYSRLEYFNDPNGFMSQQFTDAKGKSTGYKLWGITAGLELKPLDKIFIRLEGRRLQLDEDQKIFFWNGNYRNNRSEIMLNMGISF